MRAHIEVGYEQMRNAQASLQAKSGVTVLGGHLEGSAGSASSIDS
jgi:hypothetical protein